MDYDQLKALLMADRSRRRFHADRPVSRQTLLRLAELCIYTASGRNAQPLRYRLVCDPGECAALFPALSWAGYFKDWDGPEVAERPAAYMVQCLDTRFGPDCLCDDGLQLQAITLGATTLGLGGCIIKAFDAQKVSQALRLPADMKPRYVLALGYPCEEVKIEMTDGNPEADFKYWRSADGVHHVPKRPLSELIIP